MIFRKWRAKTPLDLHKAYKDTFDTEPGRRVLADLETACGFWAERGGFVPGSPDATAFNEGQRSFYLHIFRKLNQRPEDLANQHEDNDD